MRPVTVQFFKNPDILHWGFEGRWLGDDEWGDWIAVPSGSRRWKGEVAVTDTSAPAVFCAPRDRWWHLHFNDRTTKYSHFVDIVTPPVWVTDHRYEMVDLDLDVVRRQDGEVEVEDEDEFAVHQVQYHYTEEMIGRARAATDDVLAALRAGSEPFFVTAEAWLARV